MVFDFTPSNAGELLKLLTPLLSVLATYLVAQTGWKSAVKAGVAFAASALIAALTSYAEGGLVENFWTNLFAIFTAAQAIYWSVFKALGVERFFFPAEAVAGEAANQVKAQVAALPEAQVKAVADPNSSADITVATKILG